MDSEHPNETLARQLYEALKEWEESFYPKLRKVAQVEEKVRNVEGVLQPNEIRSALDRLKEMAEPGVAFGLKLFEAISSLYLLQLRLGKVS